jgi:hypothetical protein
VGQPELGTVPEEFVPGVKIVRMDKVIGPFTRALEDRLRQLETEIDRLTRQAAGASDQKEQDRYWELAREPQRESRSIRKEIWLQLRLA